MFSHRLTQFVWHIWRKYRYHISFRNGGVDAFSQRMYSLVGLGHRQLRDKLAINHSKMLAYSGIRKSGTIPGNNLRSGVPLF